MLCILTIKVGLQAVNMTSFLHLASAGFDTAAQACRGTHTWTASLYLGPASCMGLHSPSGSAQPVQLLVGFAGRDIKN